ncbi:MAG: hypothetical protein LBC48_06065 [Dysgonamonadaceae bacterium]|jgi:hypothetical protein|nr:hypothetical protein [Dysgonamonadaceae bacterium]
MDCKDVEILMEKYFEGLTSLEEEQTLRDYFQREDVQPEWEMYRNMFRYFTSERERKNQMISSSRPQVKRILLRWGSIAAAACLLLAVSLRLFLNTGEAWAETSQAYIDGKKYTDMELIRTETLKSLENLSEGSEDAYSSQIEALEIFIK